MADQSLTAFLISAFMVLSVQDACYEGAASIGQSATRSPQFATKSKTAMKTARKWRAAKVSLSQIVVTTLIRS